MDPSGAIETAGARYGLLGIGIVALAAVVVVLFRRYDKRNDQMADERKEIHEERSSHAAAIVALETKHREQIAQLKLEHEAKLREQSQKYADQITDAHRLAGDRETAVRREFADMIVQMSEEMVKLQSAADATTNKLLDRIVTGGRKP